MEEMKKESRIVHVGISELKIARAPQLIRTTGLGSCVAVIIFDNDSKMAGLAHVMLPDSSLARAGKINTAKFADTAIKELVLQLTSKGANLQRLKAKIAGGAQMFQPSGQEDFLKIGQKNIDAVKKHLSYYQIPIVAEDVGGMSGRSVEFDPETTVLTIRTVKQGIKFL